MASVRVEIYHKEGIPFDFTTAGWDLGCNEEEA